MIADECHNMGSGSLVKHLKEIPYLRRIGLSATPKRQFDDEGNEKLNEFFGSKEKYTYEYSMEEAIKNGDEVIGNTVKVKIVKNKVAPPFRKCEFDIMFGSGISRSSELVDLGTSLEILKKSGSWFSYGDSKLAQGREAVKQVLEDNPELAEEIQTKIQAKLTGKELEAIEG